MLIFPSANEIESALDIFLSLPLSGNFTIMILLYFFDKALSPSKARWFGLHLFANTLVALTAWTGMIQSLKDPLFSLDSRKYNDTSLFGSASPWPVYIINSLHVYHMLFFEVSGQELFHHLAFVPAIGFMGQFFEWGCALGFMAFFISGLPGAIDYLLLILVKYKKLNPIVQKKVCAGLNLYLRGPMVIISAHTIYIAMVYDHLTVPNWVCGIILVIALFNSLYYTKQSVSNAAISHVVATFSELTGMEMPRWTEISKRAQGSVS